MPFVVGCPFDPEVTPLDTDTDTDPTIGTATDVTGDATDTIDPDDTGTTVGEPGVLELLRIEPPNAVLELDLDTPGTFDYAVIGVFADGSEMDVTAEVEGWVVSNPEVGMMNGATLEVPAFADSFFASTLVTANIGDIEGQAQLTVAAYRQTGDQQDFFFVLPFADPAGPQEKPLTFSTDIKALDVFVNMDTTGSMGSPIANLQASLTAEVIPGIEAQIPDTYFGAGIFEDFPVDPFGEEVCDYFEPSGTDQPFELLVAMTNVSADVQAAVNSMTLPGGQPIGCGNDGPESHFESLYQIATGEGLMGPGPTSVAPNMTGIGGVGFREGSMPVVVSITDAISNEDAAGNMCLGMQSYASNPMVAAAAHDSQEALDALAAICARVVTVVVSNFNEMCGPLPDGQMLAAETGAVIPPVAWDSAPGGRPPGCAPDQCCTGIDGAGVPTDGMGLCPLVYRVSFDGSGLGAGVVDGVQNMAAYAAFDVTTQVSGSTEDSNGLPLPPGTSSADFILSVTPLEHGPVPLPGVPDPILTPDAFLGVIPNTSVTFTVEAFNSFLPQGPEPRLFVAEITVLADDCSYLDTREVFILVPPEDIVPVG
ncbi:hypothetical protein OEB96_08280 [Paraliomyxa miuraensis]|nr:hypothetical protein [Paraliomyxa miuraensis]